ncbi:MAG: histidinol-phosphate transaminase [Candidatus Margulisiibacteriota bacterium]
MLKERSVLKNIKPYVPGKEIAGNIKLASNENPLGPSPKAIDSIKLSTQQISLYPDGGCVLLRKKLADKLGVLENNLVVGNGSDELLLLIAGAYIEPGDEVIISNTTFSEYEYSARLFGASPVFIDLKEYTYDLNAISEAITSKTKIVYLCNPNNPTGTIFKQNELDKFLVAAPENVLIVIDEAYYEYVTSPFCPQTTSYYIESDKFDISTSYKNIIILRTFSKIYGLAGLRIGYGIARPEIINSLNKAREPFNVNRLAQIAATAALEDADFIKESKTNNEAGKKYLYKELKKMDIEYVPTEANFIFMNVPVDCMELFEELRDSGVTIRPMASFGCNQSIRVTIGTPEQNRFFIARLKEALYKLSGS